MNGEARNLPPSSPLLRPRHRPFPGARLLRHALILGAVCLFPIAAGPARALAAETAPAAEDATTNDGEAATPVERYLAEAGVDLHPATAAVYEARSYQPLWIDPERPDHRRADELIDALLHADDHGLDPDDYAGDRLFGTR